ncbi:MAG: primosomal protein N' [Nitrospirota bacterium]
MKFLNVLFPINLNPLTYRCPDTLLDSAEPGMIVSAPLKGRTAKGVIIGKPLMVPPGDVKDVDNIYVLKDIQKVYGDVPVLSIKMINLLRWMSEYYLTEQGLVLKNMLPKEAFTKVKQRKTKIPSHPPSIPPLPRRDTEESKGGWGDYSLNTININDGVVSGVIDSIHKTIYRTFLLHAPSSAYEYSFLIKVLPEIKNAILLIPEISLVNNLYPHLNERFGERVCLFHSELSKGKRGESIERILSGHSDIVLGTRSAIFAPLKNVSFIAVLHEHSGSYKQEGGLRYNGRDVAVKRGYFERATVLLSSTCPSIESLYNCKTGKYTLLKPTVDIKRPKVRVIDMRYERLPKTYLSNLSKTVIDASARYIKNDKKIMFLINRRGYSTLLQCSDCNYIEECPNCRIPLVLHKTDHGLRILKCHYCGYTLSNVPENCTRCKSYNIKLLGAGTQRVQEDIEEFIGIKTLRLDSDRSRKKSEIEGLIGDIYKDDIRIIVGTKLMTRRLGMSKRFSMAAILNTDLFLNLPDFRSSEKTFQEISSIIDKIEPRGEVFIQTRIPQNYLFKYLKNYDYHSFFREELNRRKSLNYPPYSRLLLIKFVSKRDIFVELSEIINKTKKIIPPHPPLVKGGRGDYKIKRIDDNVEVLGPSISKKNQGKNEFKLLLKSPIRGSLHSIARTFIEAFKDSKDVRVKIDVDPMSI